jgi:hypothetical protein
LRAPLALFSRAGRYRRRCGVARRLGGAGVGRRYSPADSQTFTQCPVDAFVSPINKPVTVCLVGITDQGTINIGGLDTTFHGPGMVQGGINLTESFGGTFNWAQALDGVSFSAPAQLLSKPVMAILGNPSGVTPPAQSQVYVAAKQAGPITFGVSNGGLVTVVPLSFHLQNPLLGPNCYVGMVGNPVTLNLTTGTSGGANVAILYGTFDLGAAKWVEHNLHE